MVTDKDYITVVQKDILFNNDADMFQGFMPAERMDFENRILNNYTSILHPSNPTNPDFNRFKQLATCCLIVNPYSRMISSYRAVPLRSSVGKNHNHAVYSSDPMCGVWSCGYVDHLGSIDKLAENASVKKNPIAAKMLENLQKDIYVEGGIIDEGNLHLLGYINNNANAVSQAHFGMVYVLPTDAPIVGKNDSDSRMISFSGLTKLVESNKDMNSHISTDFWTAFSYGPLKNYLTEKYPDIF